jgi:hypothetical protein
LYLLKNYFLSVGPFDISTESFLSLLSFHPKFSLSPSHFLSVLSALSSFFALSVVGVAGVGLVLRWLGLPAWAWACRRGGGSSVVGFSVDFVLILSVCVLILCIGVEVGFGLILCLFVYWG